MGMVVSICRPPWNANTQARLTNSAGSSCSRQTGCRGARAPAGRADTTCTRAPSAPPSAKRRAELVFGSDSLVIRCDTRLRRTCSNQVATSELCRNCLASRTSRPRWSTRTCCNVELAECGVRWTFWQGRTPPFRVWADRCR